MLRELDPETNFTTPKSAAFVPTKEEESKFGEDGLSRIAKQLDDDEQWKIDRAIRLKQRDLILDMITEEALKSKAKRRAE